MKKDFFDKIEFFPSLEELNFLKKNAKEVCSLLKKEIIKKRIGADLFLGGSFAKGTLTKDEKYDIDVFIRFHKDGNLSEKLEKVVKEVANKNKWRYKLVHGSRDYFQIYVGENVVFEAIPVLKISKIKYAKNVTDQSYFHVNYVKKKLNKKIALEIAVAKRFFKAQKIYGAESYIGGFSGYALECLIIHFRSFEKMLKILSNAESRLIIDPEKHYKKKENIFIEINEAKLKSPIVLVDPTWKERNVLAALNEETFSRFKEAAKKYLSNPAIDLFEDMKDETETIRKVAKKNSAEFINLVLKTDRQEGDIAGTKMKKFSRYLLNELGKYFLIIASSFKYEKGKEAVFCIALKSKKEIIRNGPPAEMQKESRAFKKANKNVFEKGGNYYARIKIDFSAMSFLKEFSDKQKDKMNEMGIVDINIKGD